MLKHLYEHLKTKKKYNTLQLKYNVKCEDLERKQVELNVERQIWKKKQEIWEKQLKELAEENIKLKSKEVKKK